jgi:hypothetical protein
MAKYLASEYGKEVVEDAFRIHGGYREVPMLLIGEGTAETQKMIVGRSLLEEYQATGDRGDDAVLQDPRPVRRGAWTELLLFLFLTALTGAVALIETRRLGLSRRMLATRTTPATLIAGKPRARC